jgi:nitric oxide reductase activation protein
MQPQGIVRRRGYEEGEDLAMQGVYTYCLTLDPTADRYVAHIFGENNCSIVDNVERLLERLPNVFAALTA